MDILAKMPVVVEAETINEAYLKLLSEFKSDEKRYESKSAVVNINDIYHSQLPAQIPEPFNEYYSVFVQNALLEQKWSLSNNDWFLSYGRRIMSERNGINPWTKAKQELLKNSSSRRCIILTYREEDDFLSYLPSLLSIQFTIVDDRMNMLTNWRSKELYTAFPVNVLCMHSLMRMMFREMKVQYDTLSMGVYTEVIGSLHKLSGRKKPKQFGDSLTSMDLETVKFYWSVLENGKEKVYDRNYEETGMGM